MTADARWPGATSEASKRLDGVDPDNAARIRRCLREVASQGCLTHAPSSVRTDYLNIARPPGSGRARLASLTVRTGRVEFQTNSWDVATRSGLAAYFDQLPAGNKAAISLRTDEDLDAAITVANAILAGRAGA